MNISCHGCGRHFRVRQDRLPSAGARTRCPRCDEVLVITGPEGTSSASQPTRKTAEADTDLFELPPSDLEHLQEDDLFALGNGNGHSDGRQESAPLDEGNHPRGPEGGTSAQESPGPERRPGFWGWLGRLFGRGA